MNFTKELILVCYANQTISFRKWRPLESPVSIILTFSTELNSCQLAFYHGAFPVRAFLRALN